jgi:tetratricopeptide (TPR) repeat protein
MSPRHYGAYAYRGRAKESLKLFTDAIADYNTALKLNPKFGEGYYYRGMYFKNNGNDPKKACEDLKQAKKLGYNVSDADLKDCE